MIATSYVDELLIFFKLKCGHYAKGCKTGFLSRVFFCDAFFVDLENN